MNTGAAALVVVDLPQASSGIKYTFVITDADGFRLKATNGDTITISGTTSSANGTMTCAQVGGSVTIYGSSGGWYASASARVWQET